MPLTISVPNALRQSVEAASGGLNTVMYDDLGHPSIMVVIPKFNLSAVGLGSGVHPAFIVDGVEKDYIYVAKYPGIIHNARAVSNPGQDPGNTVDWAAADLACTAKGTGWHMMTNAEWAAVALLAHQQGFEPHGNTNYGRDHANTSETARRQDGLAPGTASGNARTLTGAGPASWYHDNTPFGVADLCGNVWEWVRGLRLNGGEIQIIADNNAAVTTSDHGVSSAAWKAILEDGTLVAPGTANTLKWDTTGATGTGAPRLATSIVNQSSGAESAAVSYAGLTAPGLTVPARLKALALHPHVTTMTRGYVYSNNQGERLPIRGGSWGYGGNAGVFALHLADPRSSANAAVGFRPAFVL